MWVSDRSFQRMHPNQGLGQTCQKAADGRALCQCAVGTCSSDGSCDVPNPFVKAWSFHELLVSFNSLHELSVLYVFCAFFPYFLVMPN